MSNERIVENSNQIITKFGEKVKSIDEKVVSRIFKPRFGVSAYWGEVSDTIGGSYTSTFEKMQNDIYIWKAHGVDEAIIPLHIGYNTTNNDIFLAENLDLIKQGCIESISNGIKISCIKVHVMKLTNSNVTTMGESNFISRYTQIIQNICDKFNDINLEYFIPFNEVNWIHSDPNRTNFVINIINLCKTYNYKVSISTAGAEESFNMNSNIQIELNAISVNHYQSISAKDIITNTDSFNSWNNSNLCNFAQYFKNKYPEKEFIVTETGVNDYKDALKTPELSFGTEQNGGIYQDIYINGVFDYLNKPFVDRVWWWFGFRKIDNVTTKTTNYFLRGDKFEF